VPATAALAALGIPGAVGLESMFFADVESERMQAEGAAYDPAKALPANLASALPQMVLERAFGVERLMNKVLGEIPKQAGKVAFGDFAKQFIRQGLAAGVEEGITEPTQGFWNDYMAQMTYDQQRETLTGDGAKRRLLESVSAFALGSMFGGGITTLETIDRNRAVGKGAEYLTTKTGQLLTESDFNVLREVKTDEQILGTAPDPETAKVLLAAANGNKAAQADYNNRVMAAQFVKTDGMEVGGMTLGLVQETPVVKMADGVIVPLDMTNKEDAAFVDSFKAEVVKAQALKETVDFLNKRIEVGRQVLVSPEVKTLQDFVNEAKIEMADAAKRIGIARDVTAGKANIPEGATPADVQVLGANVAEYTAGVYRDVSTVYAGADPLIAVEEVAEGYLKKRLAVGDLTDAQITEWRTAYEAATGEKTDTAGTVSNIEWFSKRVVDYAVANREAVGLPKSWEGFFLTLGEHIKTVFKMAERIIKMKKDGQLPADFENAIKGALGLMEVSEVTDAIERRDTAPIKDFTGVVDQQAASAEAKKAKQKAQLGLDITFATTGIPQTAIQALQAQAQRIRSKKLMATGDLIARIQAGTPIPARVKAVRRSTQASLLARIAVPVSSRLKAIAPELGVRLRRFEFDTGQRLTADYQRVLPFAQAVESMKDGDAALLDLALKNGGHGNPGRSPQHLRGASPVCGGPEGHRGNPPPGGGRRLRGGQDRRLFPAQGGGPGRPDGALLRATPGRPPREGHQDRQ
jgi:hypothetical protein